MDSINVERIQALRKYKEQQFVSNLWFYPLATLSFGLFCTSPFWVPSLYGSTKTLVCVSIPRVLSFFLSVKSLFILGNIIVIFLLRDSKFQTMETSYNNSSENGLVKPILAKTGSKKTKMHGALGKKSKVRPSKPSYDNEVERADPMKPTLPSTDPEKVKMHVTFSQTTNRIVVSEGLPNRTYVDPYLTCNIDRLRVSSTKVRDQTGEKQEEGAPWQVKESTARKEEKATQVGGKVREKRKNELKIDHALSKDDLKRRSDDFIAMVNKQLRLEAEDVMDDDVQFLDAC